MLDSTASSQVRIATLRKRWEADRGSSAFLPLAEEYRRLGRFRDAIETLQAGLRMQPSYLSAQVALGRCLLESGDAPGAGLALERVLATDPTQLVANKLLVEAHLRAGKAGEALERLDAYTDLNDRDPDVPGLRQRIFKALQREPPPLASGRGGRADSPGSRVGGASRPAPRAEVGDAAPLFEIHAESEPAADLSSLWDGGDEPARGVEAEPGPADHWPPESGNGDELFAGLGTTAAHTRYLAALFSEGLFARVPDLEPAAPPEPEPPAPSAVTAPEATVTLGELYRRQGHLGDAAQIFNAVLDREPDNAAAQDGLALTHEAAHTAPIAAPEPPESMLAEGVTVRKIRALRGYLQSLRRGATPDVP